MTIIDAGFVASGVILAVAIIDAVRGRSGLGKYRLSKERSPDRFWAAVVLYFNMAFVLFWMTGRAHEASAEAVLNDPDNVALVVVGESE